MDKNLSEKQKSLLNKEERKNFRLGRFDVKLLKVASRFRCGGNESLWFFQHIWKDATAMLSSEFFENEYTPYALETMFLYAFGRLVEAPPEAEKAETWITQAIDTLDRIGNDPWTKQSKMDFKAMMSNYPTEWVQHLAKTYSEVAVLLPKLNQNQK